MFYILALDGSVINIVGIDSSSNTLYGLAANGRAIMSSVDGGSTWASISYRNISPDVDIRMKLPWEKTNYFIPGSGVPEESYTMGNWGGELSD